jgi:hypothetical protein
MLDVIYFLNPWGFGEPKGQPAFKTSTAYRNLKPYVSSQKIGGSWFLNDFLDSGFRRNDGHLVFLSFRRKPESSGLAAIY